MKNLLGHLFSLDESRSIWVEEEDLGKEIPFYHKNNGYSIRIPNTLVKTITLRLKGLGKTRRSQTGDLYLHVWLNKGEDIHYSLWLSETSAKNGGNKPLMLDGKVKTLGIPQNSHDGLIIRLKGLGKKIPLNPRAPALHDKKRGNALVRLIVYPDHIAPRYGSFETLSTDDMVLEGWVYRKIDEVIHKVGKSFFEIRSLTADTIADSFNEKGWKSIFQTLVDHLNLSNLNITLTQSDSMTRPGLCEGTAVFQNNTPVGYKYKITINSQFIDNPFFVAAILAHELCHVVNSEKIEKIMVTSGVILKSEKATLEEERTVDLLVFMFKIGEFQLRIARDKRLTLGYFDQEIFDRIQVIVARKMKSF